MTKATQRQIAILKNKIARATQRPDPTGMIIAGLKAEIARLECTRPLPMNGTDDHHEGES